MMMMMMVDGYSSNSSMLINAFREWTNKIHNTRFMPPDRTRWEEVVDYVYNYCGRQLVKCHTLKCDEANEKYQSEYPLCEFERIIRAAECPGLDRRTRAHRGEKYVSNVVWMIRASSVFF